MTCPDLRPAFPHTAEFLVDGQVHLHDVDFDVGCGYVSTQEAALLYDIARSFRKAGLPPRWMEIGSHTGWSAAHIAAATCWVDAIEPRFAEPDFYARAVKNWERAGVDRQIKGWPLTSEKLLPWRLGPSYRGAFIDGNHDAPAPTRDAQLVLPHLLDDAVVVFHDHVGQPVRDAVAWLAEQGFHVRVYDTSRGMAVCWRGEWTPPELQP